MYVCICIWFPAHRLFSTEPQGWASLSQSKPALPRLQSENSSPPAVNVKGSKIHKYGCKTDANLGHVDFGFEEHLHHHLFLYAFPNLVVVLTMCEDLYSSLNIKRDQMRIGLNLAHIVAALTFCD